MDLDEGNKTSPMIAIYEALRVSHPQVVCGNGPATWPRLDSWDRVDNGHRRPIPGASRAHREAATDRRPSHHRRLLCSCGMAGRLESPSPRICSMPVCRRSRSTMSPSNSMSMARLNEPPYIHPEGVMLATGRAGATSLHSLAVRSTGALLTWLRERVSCSRLSRLWTPSLRGHIFRGGASGA